METIVIDLGFFLMGVSAGVFAFLIYRMSILQERFRWSGALSVATTLGGGGYLTYLSQPIHFGLYSIGFFSGVTLYSVYLAWLFQKNVRMLEDRDSLLRELLERLNSIGESECAKRLIELMIRSQPEELHIFSGKVNIPSSDEFRRAVEQKLTKHGKLKGE